MVKGLDLFIEHFLDYADHYILIGGSACDAHFNQLSFDFRATKDLDIVLIIETLSAEFVNHFYGFIKSGEYVLAEVDSKKCFYRFQRPNVEGYPYMLELFSRNPNLLSNPTEFHLTDIPTGEEASSLSAILLDNDYYHFTVNNSRKIGGLHLANEFALICLKAKAFLNNRQRKLDGAEVQEKDIAKHKNDVIRLVSTMPGDKTTAIPESIARDLQLYIQLVRAQNVDVKTLLKPMGITGLTLMNIVERMRQTFGLEEI